MDWGEIMVNDNVETEFGKSVRHGLTVALLALLTLCATCYGCERESELSEREALRALSSGAGVATIRCATSGYDCDVAAILEER